MKTYRHICLCVILSLIGFPTLVWLTWHGAWGGLLAFCLIVIGACIIGALVDCFTEEEKRAIDSIFNNY